MFYFINYEPARYAGYEYPVWGQVLGFLISLSSMVIIPGYAVYYVMVSDKPLAEVSILWEEKTLVEKNCHIEN